MRNAISFEKYSFTYAGSERPALKEINLEVKDSEIVLIVGPSGCGKSTLLRCINGLIPHMFMGNRVGDVKVDGIEVSKSSIANLATKVGFVFQNPENQIFMFSVERDIAFGLQNIGLPRDEIRSRVDWALNLLGISGLAHRAPHELSDGQKQRVALAGVLVMKPKILILDEPTSLLDPRTALELVGLLRDLNSELGMTIVIAEHRLDSLAPICSRIVGISDGHIIFDGPPREVLSKDDAFSFHLIAKLANRLIEGGLDLGTVPLTVDELCERLNGIINDRVRIGDL